MNQVSISSSASRWHTTDGGVMICAGVGGPITGRGGHLIIVDDPVKNFVEWISQQRFQNVLTGKEYILVEDTTRKPDS